MILLEIDLLGSLMLFMFINKGWNLLCLDEANLFWLIRLSVPGFGFL